MTERRTGTAKGVPYLAIPPPEGTENPGLVAILHGLDHPNSEDTMDATLPLQDMPACLAREPRSAGQRRSCAARRPTP